ncbi:uncharacterized protein LOC142368235 [Odontesthes bonariensis]|uniref:uncharacterized protein LOC142368235 n=1 Tax=Odontesthes bonariensis TaxID=219752 RepID=UPI003F5874CD
MVWLRLELLVTLSWILLLVSGRGWVRIDESQLLRFYETGQWSDPLNLTAAGNYQPSPADDDVDYDYKDVSPEETESFATREEYSEAALKNAEGVSADDYDDYSYEDEIPDKAEGGKTSHEDEFLEAEGVPADDYIYEDEIPDGVVTNEDSSDPFLEVEGVATTETFDPFADELDEFDSGPNDQLDGTEGGFHVEFVAAPPRSWIGCTSLSSDGLHVVCTEDGFQISLPPGLLSEVQVMGFKSISFKDAPKHCGYHMNQLNNTLSVPFTGCSVREDVEDLYSLQLSLDLSGQTLEFIAFCVENATFNSGQFLRAFGKRPKCNKPANALLPPTTADLTRCSHQTTAPPTTVKPAAAKPTQCLHGPITPKSKLPTAHNCAVHIEEQISCGHLGTSPSDCEKRGCCVGLSKHACYYPLDECTVDGHFVFAIRHTGASIPVDPEQLVIPGRPLCKPAIVNDKVAIFKISLEGCGALSYEVGETKIYLIEVHTVVKALNLKYGMITRSDPLRLLFECHYRKHGSAQGSVASVGYTVKTSTSNMPSSIISSGFYGIDLKIAKDHTYSSYFPSYHQPLRLLLGQPIYLELSLKSPKPDAVILVNYCLAYPRSAKKALVLIYEGCANPNDPNISILKVIDHPNRHQRRFLVTAFQFMDQETNLYLNEEIYFMCSTEVCLPAENTCEERCFDGKAT